MDENDLTPEDLQDFNPVNGRAIISRRKRINRLELEALLDNSLKVVESCELLVQHWIKKEQYFKANEAKVAAYCHRNFANRLTRILKGGEAFPLIIIDEEENNISERHII